MNANGTYKNPLFALYRDMIPAPNQNFVEQGAIPTEQLLPGRRAEPDERVELRRPRRLQRVARSDRFFFRYAGTTFHEQLGDWTYESPNPKYHGMHVNDKTRYSWAYTGNWTKVTGFERVRHAVFGQSLLRRSAAPGPAQVQADRRRSSELPRRVLQRGEQLHDARHQVGGIPGRLERLPTAALDATHVQAQSNRDERQGRLTRCAAASTTAWRCAGTN